MTSRFETPSALPGDQSEYDDYADDLLNQSPMLPANEERPPENDPIDE